MNNMIYSYLSGLFSIKTLLFIQRGAVMTPTSTSHHYKRQTQIQIVAG